MSNQDRQNRLTAAIQAILEVRDSFPKNEKICCECGMTTFANWNEKQIRDQLNGSISRLEKVIDRIKRTEGKTKR